MKYTIPCAFVFALVATAGNCQQAAADGSFNQEDWAPASSWEANGEDMEKSLLSEIERALGADHRRAMEARIAQNEGGMRPIFLSLTKNEYGKLGHASVRYMLHRYFVEKHGWFIQGLFAEGEALNGTSPTLMLKDRVPKYVQGLFEKRLGGRGFGLHEMAVLVAVVENSVHQEAQQELNKTYQVLGVPLTAKFKNSSANVMVERYMTGFILKANLSEISADEFRQQYSMMAQYYPTWPMARRFLSNIRLKHTQGRSTLEYADIWRIIQEVIDTFGTFQGRQCQGLKRQLTALEKRGSAGCVDLPDFYDKGLKYDSNWLFVESQDYLRHIGALDETDSKNPRVLTANYINGPNSCLQPSGYYLVCCHNECDDILGHVEKQLVAPSGTPKEILAALPAPASQVSLRSSVKPPLARSLLRRLDEVASHHGGRVPIHGRLFAQWLHHAFPRECPFPHLSGTRSPEWMDGFEETGAAAVFSDAQMQSLISASKPSNRTLPQDSGSCAPWTAEEELFAPLPESRALSLAELEEDPHVWRFASSLSLVALVSAMAVHAMRLYSSLLKLKRVPKMLEI